MEEHRIEVGEAALHDWVSRVREKPGEVVMVFLRPGGKVLLSTKEFYPPGTYRMPTGSMHHGETPAEALIREVREETGFRVSEWKTIGTIHWTFTHDSDTAEYYSHVFLIPETTEEPVSEDPNEQITDYREVPVCDLREVGESLMRMEGRWHDWGVFRGMVHTFVYSKLCR